jgi:hypothetical protein
LLVLLCLVGLVANYELNFTKISLSLGVKSITLSMLPANFSDSDLLKQLLSPLLDDFEYWFERSHTLLASGPTLGTAPDVQADLLGRVEQAQQAVVAARSLLNVTDGQAGVDTQVLLQWHKLVTECWQVARLHRQLQSS